jgi:hypothetical protein
MQVCFSSMLRNHQGEWAKPTQILGLDGSRWTETTDRISVIALQIGINSSAELQHLRESTWEICLTRSAHHVPKIFVRCFVLPVFLNKISEQ